MSRASRRNRDRNQGLAVILGTTLIFAGMLYLCHLIDARNGITTCQSLANWGMHLCG